MELRHIAGTHKIEQSVAGHATAGTADQFVLGKVPFDATVTAVYFTAAAGVSGAATNNFQLDVRNVGSDGTGTDDLASLEFASGTDATAFEPVAITLDSALVAVTAGDVLVARKVVNGTGLAMPDGVVTVEFEGR